MAFGYKKIYVGINNKNKNKYENRIYRTQWGGG